MGTIGIVGETVRKWCHVCPVYTKGLIDGSTTSTRTYLLRLLLPLMIMVSYPLPVAALKHCLPAVYRSTMAGERKATVQEISCIVPQRL